MADTQTDPEQKVRAQVDDFDVPADIDPAETEEWLDSLDYIIERRGPERAAFLLEVIENRARQAGVAVTGQGEGQDSHEGGTEEASRIATHAALRSDCPGPDSPCGPP